MGERQGRRKSIQGERINSRNDNGQIKFLLAVPVHKGTEAGASLL